MISDTFDVFISHASEDKDAVARPMAKLLEGLGIKVWLDEQELSIGDQLRKKINLGLSKSRYGIVILSPDFFKKSWPQEELDALMNKEEGNEKIVLPIRHNISHSEVRALHPTLANKLSASTENGLSKLVADISSIILGENRWDKEINRTKPIPSVPVGHNSRASSILSTLRELEVRVNKCIDDVVERKVPTASVSSSSTLIKNVLSRDEAFAVDKSISNLCLELKGHLPEESEWRGHWQRLDYLGSIDRDPKNTLEAFQEQLNWIRLSKTFVSELGVLEASSKSS